MDGIVDGCDEDGLQESEYLCVPVIDSALDEATTPHRRRGPVAPLEQQVLVKMIDFAHALPGTGHIDNGYMVGLHSLISKLNQVALEHDKLSAHLFNFEM